MKNKNGAINVQSNKSMYCLIFTLFKEVPVLKIYLSGRHGGLAETVDSIVWKLMSITRTLFIAQ